MPVLPLDLPNDIPDGWVPIEVVSVVKCLDDEGETALCVRTSGGLSAWEAVGMLTAGSDAARSAMQADFRSSEE